MDRSVLGINAQFIKSGALQIRTLAVSEFDRSHSGENIKCLILEVLSKFNLSVEQVFSITTDNARNMLKAIELVSEDNIISPNDEHEDEDDDNNSIDIELQDVLSIKCAAHTLQLAVKDALNNNSHQATISQCRRLAKKLRTPGVMNILKTKNFPMPIVDVVTRWGSIFDMISRLVKLRPFIDDFIGIIGKEFELTPNVWEEINEILQVINCFSFVYG